MHTTGTFHNLFYCTFQTLNFFYKLKIYGNPEESWSNSTIFPRAYAHFMSLHHILVILTVFQTFPLSYCYICLSSVIFDDTIVIILRLHKPCPHKMAKLIEKCKCSHCFSDRSFLSLSLDFPLPWDTTMIILGQLITLKLHLNDQIKRRVTCLSL